jgi:hypothetical protein
MIRDTQHVFHHAPVRVLNGTCPLGYFSRRREGFHTQRLETAKGLIDLFQRAEGAGFVYRQPSQPRAYTAARSAG